MQELEKKFYINTNIRSFLFYISLAEVSKAYESFHQIENKYYDLLIRKVIELRIYGLFSEFIKFHNLGEIIKKDSFKRAEERKVFLGKKNLILFKDSIEITKKLKEHGVNYRMLKGYQMSLNYYEDISIREMRDLDILVKKVDLVKTLKVFSRLGYKTQQKANLEKTESLTLSEDKFYDLPKLISPNGTIVEVHFSLGMQKNISNSLIQMMFEEEENISIGSNLIKTSSNEALFAHILYHGTSKEYFTPGFIMFYDLLLLFKKTNHAKLMQNIEIANLKEEYNLIISLMNKYSENQFPLISNQKLPDKELTQIGERLLIKRKIPNELINLYFDLKGKKGLNKLTFLKNKMIEDKKTILHLYLPRKNKFIFLLYIKRWFYLFYLLISYATLKGFNLLDRQEIKDIKILRGYFIQN